MIVSLNESWIILFEIGKIKKQEDFSPWEGFFLAGSSFFSGECTFGEGVYPFGGECFLAASALCSEKCIFQWKMGFLVGSGPSEGEEVPQL